MAGDGPSRMSRRGFLTAAIGSGAIAITGCVENPRARRTGGQSGGPLTGQIKVAGSSTVFPLAVQMRRVFQRIHPGVDVSVKSTGTGGGFANHFCPGNTDFNNASREITDQELAQCRSNGVEPIELKVATDAITVIVNNDADWFDGGCISVDTLAEIWSPETKPTTWSDVDPSWPSEEIKLFGPTEASGTFDYFTKTVVGEEGKSRTDYQATEQDNTILTGVRNNPYAMGYLGFAYFSENKNAVKALAINDGDDCVPPSLETAKSGAYTPLSRPLYTYPAQSALSDPAVAAFARFWVEMSTSTDLVARRVGYIPNSIAEQTEQRQRLTRAIEEATE